MRIAKSVLYVIELDQLKIILKGALL